MKIKMAKAKERFEVAGEKIKVKFTTDLAHRYKQKETGTIYLKYYMKQELFTLNIYPIRLSFKFEEKLKTFSSPQAKKNCRISASKPTESKTEWLHAILPNQIV